MKFHYTIASCVTLLCYLPLVAVADIATTTPFGGDDRRPPAFAPLNKDIGSTEGTCHDGTSSGATTEHDQIQRNNNLPCSTTEIINKQTLTDKDFCDGKTIHRTLACGSILGDDISLNLVSGTTYTMKVQRLTCALDPFSRFIGPDGTTVIGESDDFNYPLPFLFCDHNANGVPAADPQIRFRPYRPGDFTLRTFPAAGDCPPDGEDAIYEYQVKISCERLHRFDQGKTWRERHLDDTLNVIYGWYRHGLLLFLRCFHYLFR
jgi:hypothetical protein